MVTPADVWIPVLSALAGALIGSLASIITTLVRSRADARLAMAKMAVKAAIHDHNGLREIALARGGPYKLAPLSASIYYHRQIMDVLDRNKLTPESLKRVQKRVTKLPDIMPGSPKSS